MRSQPWSHAECILQHRPPQLAGKGRLAITYFAKEGLQGLVVACSCGSSLARHVRLYPSPLQGAARPHQAQVCQPFLEAMSVMQELKCTFAAQNTRPMFCLCAYACLPSQPRIVCRLLACICCCSIYIHAFTPVLLLASSLPPFIGPSTHQIPPLTCLLVRTRSYPSDYTATISCCWGCSWLLFLQSRCCSNHS